MFLRANGIPLLQQICFDMDNQNTPATDANIFFFFLGGGAFFFFTQRFHSHLWLFKKTYISNFWGIYFLLFFLLVRSSIFFVVRLLGNWLHQPFFTFLNLNSWEFLGIKLIILIPRRLFFLYSFLYFNRKLLGGGCLLFVELGFGRGGVVLK